MKNGFGRFFPAKRECAGKAKILNEKKIAEKKKKV